MFKLRSELRAHESDVRGIASAPSSELIATASRDKTIGIWRLGLTEPVKILKGHTHFVNDVLFMNDNTLISASNDKTLRIWDIESGECTHTLEGHTSSVCAIALLNSPNLIVSASWDSTARIWNTQSGKCLYELKGHSAAVWNVITLKNGNIITVAADKSIKLWDVHDFSNDQFTSVTYSTTLSSIHTDVIRDVTTVNLPASSSSSSSSSSPCSFVTVANDSLLVAWKSNGNTHIPSSTQSDLHDGNYIYSVDIIPSPSADGNCTVITGGEDNALRITNMMIDGENISLQPGQVIMHPGTVWSVCKGPDSHHIISACSDGVARIFTNDASLAASKEDQAEFEKLISKRQVDSRLIGGVDVTKLPDSASLLSQPGKKDGENRIVKTNDGKAEVHMWSDADQKWSKVGDVVDGPGGTTGAVPGKVKGKDYDFVFEVEIGDGGNKEKLGYNKGENPYLAAQRFVDDNELSQEFLDQIAQFIEQQVPPEALPNRNQNAPSDPLTGGSRYVPGGGGVNNSTAGDPLTGGSRYVPGGAPGNNSNNPSLPPPRKLIPYKDGMITYRNSDQLDKIQQKVSAANTELAKAESPLALTMDEAKIFGQSLMMKLKSTRNGSDLVLSDEECAVIEKMMEWPTSNSGLFAALDIGRLIISAASGGAYFFGKKNGAILDVVLQHLGSDEAKAPVHIMGCRFLCNLFGNRVVRETARAKMKQVIDIGIKGAGSSANRKARETFASVLVNYAVLCIEIGSSLEERQVIIEQVVKLVKEGERDEEVAFRLMIAMGTVMCGSDEAAKKAVELGAAQTAADCAPLSPRLQQVALDIATMIAA